MFEKKIFINADSLIVGQKKILWPRIVGVRTQEGKALESIAPNFPRAEIFLENGKVVVVSNRNIFFDGSKVSNNLTRISCGEAIRKIQKNAVNAKSILSKWFEWRLGVPIILAEIIALSVAVIRGITIENLVLFVIAAGVIGAPLGAYWERRERRKFCQRK